MFVITLNKKNVKKIVAGALAVVLVFGIGTTIRNVFFEEQEVFGSQKVDFEMETTEDMLEYITLKGYTVNMQSAEVKEVKIPKKFDAEFENFDNKIKEADGLSLSKHKNDDVEKWTFEIENYGVENKEGVIVLLVKKEELVGSYILENPGGIAVPLTQKISQDISSNDTTTETIGEFTQDTTIQTNGESTTFYLAEE